MAEKNVEGAGDDRPDGAEKNIGGAGDDRHEHIVDDEILRCVQASLQDGTPIHVLARTEKMAKQLAQTLADKFGPEKVSFAAFDAPSVPTTPVVVSVASTILKNLGVEAGQVRAEVERFYRENIRMDPQTVMPDKLLYTPRAREAVAHARLEAADLGHNKVGTEHLLFGLTHDMDRVSAIVLKDMGVTIETVRAEYRKVIADEAD